jgi:hypothetical protein
MSLFRKAPGRGAHSRGAPPHDQPRRADLDERPAWMVDGMSALLFEGREDLEVVGESHYQDNLWRLVGGRPADPEERVRADIVAVLAAEPDNSYDANAIAVWIDGLKVGHLSHNDARLYQPGLLVLQEKHGTPVALSGVIVGGGMRDDGPGRLGVFLQHDPRDFGISRPQLLRLAESKTQTGTSDTLATGYADDSHHLSWMTDLPADDIRAIPMLRRLLGGQGDPLVRHFMYAR